MDSDTCLRCGAPYAPGQTVCFKCGAPLGETRPNTQPVPVVRIPRPEETTPPAGSPAVEVPAPAHAAARIASATAEPPAPFPSRTRRQRRWPLVALILVIILLAAGGGGFYLVRALTAAPPVSTQTLYQDPQHRFHFERPTLWTATATTDGVTLTDAAGTSTITVAVDQPNPGDTAQSRADTLAKSLNLVAAPSQAIGGDTWEQRTGQFTGADGAVRQTVVYVTLHDGLIYIIQFSSPVASFTSLDNLVLQPLLASFQFS